MVVTHLRECGRPPARLLVLVDQHRPYAFVEVVPRHHMLRQPVFEDKRRLEIIIPPDDQLAQRDLEASRRLGQQVRPRLRGPAGIAPPDAASAASASRISSMLWRRQSTDRSPAAMPRAEQGRDLPRSGRASHRSCPARSLSPRRSGRARRPVPRSVHAARRGWQSRNRACRPPPSGRRSGRDSDRYVPGQRFRNRVAPTSGNRPIAVSGIARSVRSVAMR